MKIIISPYSKKLRNGNNNPKNYPYWEELVLLLKNDNYIIQIGVDGEGFIKGCNEYKFNLSFKELEDLTLSCDSYISVDNFYPHFCNTIGKYGVVIWGQSNPKLFGYKNNINIFKNIKYFRDNQFFIWEQCKFKKDSFCSANEIFQKIKSL